MRLRLQAAAMILFALAAVVFLWPWHRTYEGRRATCGPAIFVAFPNDPGDLRGAERRAADRCKTFDVQLFVVGAALSSAGSYAVLRSNRDRRSRSSRDRHSPSGPMRPPGTITRA